MKVYDPRIDTAPGAHPRDVRFHVETNNPVLIFATLCSPQPNQGFWQTIVEQAIYCDAEVPEPMTEARARQILGSVIEKDQLPTGFFSEPPEQNRNDGEEDTEHRARLDGRFTADHLEAIAWWMRNRQR